MSATVLTESTNALLRALPPLLSRFPISRELFPSHTVLIRADEASAS